MYAGLTYNQFGNYWEGDYEAARWDAEERRMQREEREADAMTRMSKLYAEMNQEFCEEGKTRRFHSLMCRAEALRELWWHPSPL